MNQPRHTPAEAVQYWYDAATERREERDRLRAVVARIAQMADYWEQNLPEVIRTPAVVSALRAAMEPAVQSPAVGAAGQPVCDLPHETIAEEDACDRRLATDRDDLRDRIADAIREAACPGDCGKTEEECAKERIQPFAWHHGRLAVVEGEPEQFADAVLPVLPEVADRAAILCEAADRIDETRDGFPIAVWNGITWATSELRRMAAGAQQQPERCPHGCDVSRCPCLACEADDTEEQQEPTDEDVVEAHRLALSFALDLGTGAPWDAIDERVAELRRLAGEQHAQDEAVRCTCADAGDCFAPAGHYADCPLAAPPTT